MSRVLIVEDDLATLFAMKRLFTDQGWEVSLSKTVSGALAHLEPPPDWIVLDMGLADGDGQDVLRYVRHAGLASRVAIVSALLDPERLESLSSLAPDLVLQKPIRFVDLIEACGVGDETEGTVIPSIEMRQGRTLTHSLGDGGIRRVAIPDFVHD